MENVTFSVSGIGPSDASLSSGTYTTSLIELNDLAVGLWEITISGNNSEGKKISNCTFQTIIRKSQVTTEFVTLIPVIGTGGLDFYIEWEDPSGIMINPEFQLSFESGEDLSVKKTVQVSPMSSNSASFYSSLDNGWYLVTASLFEGSPLEPDNSSWWQETFSLRIVSEENTAVTMFIPETDIIHRGTGVSNIIIQEDMENEFSVSYSGTLDSILPGETIILSTTTNHTSSAQYRWYVNGDLQVGINQRNLDYQFLSSGRYHIALFVIDNGSISGYHQLFTVINPIPVSQIVLDQGNSISKSTGLSVQLSASLSPDDATYKDVIWSSSDNTIAEVDQEGLVELKN
jgi:hypothetical protein